MFRFATGMVAVAVLLSVTFAQEQEMPDPALIHGRAIPEAGLADGTVTVRVVREAIGNNVPGQQVQVTVGGTSETATTDDLGRAEFSTLPPGGQAVAEVTVDGERLASEPFVVPARGGLRVILVAGLARAAERRAAEEAAAAAAPPVTGIVVFGGNSRVLIQYNDESLDVYYVLEVVNSARARVDVGEPLRLELPAEATGATVLDGSWPGTTVDGRSVTVTGPFPSGSTPVQVAYRLPYSRSELALSQTWPAAMPQLIVGVEKIVDGMELRSPQLPQVNDLTVESGEVFLFGTGPGLPAGGTLVITLSGLPAHSRTPRYVAIGLALGIVGIGVWLSLSGGAVRTGEQQKLVARRDSLLGQLAKLDANRRTGATDAGTHARRRARLLEELEQVYAELDELQNGPAGGGEGVAA